MTAKAKDIPYLIHSGVM